MQLLAPLLVLAFNARLNTAVAAVLLGRTLSPHQLRGTLIKAIKVSTETARRAEESGLRRGRCGAQRGSGLS